MGVVKQGQGEEYIKQTTGFIGHPRPLGALFMAEFWERFSFYGIKPVLIFFMIATIYQGGLGLDNKTASAVVGIFIGSTYLLTIPGGWLADNWLGQQRSVWYGSIIIALGHLSIATSHMISYKMFYLGLALISIGIGLFKTCISVMVGNLYNDGSEKRDAGFSIFYMGINLGSFVSALITGWFAAREAWALALGIGGLGMLAALVVFRIFTIPSMEKYAATLGIKADWKEPVRKLPYVGLGVSIVAALLVIYTILLFADVVTIDPNFLVVALTYIVAGSIIGYFAVLLLFIKLDKKERLQLLLCFFLLLAAAGFWSAFEQYATTYNLFSKYYLDLNFFGFLIPATWITQGLNGLLIIIFAPIFGYIWLYLARRNKQPNSVSKFILGLIFGALGFLVMLIATYQVAFGADGSVVSKPSFLWMVLSFLFLTFGELSLSPVGLSAMTSLSPSKLRGQVVGLWFGASSLGSFMAGIIGGEFANDSVDSLKNIFSHTIILLLICAVVLAIIAYPVSRALKNYKD